MNIYEYGASVAQRDRIRNGRDSDIPKTFVCVPECAENRSMEEAFAQMCEVLSSKGIGVVTMQQPDATTASGDKYTLAHEKVLTPSGEVVVKPSNLIRFILGRTFTKDTLYLDENGEVVELHNAALRDIGNGAIGLTGDFNTMVEVNPNIIADCMYEMVKGAYLNDRLSDTLARLPSWIKPITAIEGSLAEVLKPENLATFLSYLGQYKSVSKYYMQKCGLVFTPSLDPSKITDKPTEKKEEPKTLTKKAPIRWATSSSPGGGRITIAHTPDIYPDIAFGTSGRESGLSSGSINIPPTHATVSNNPTRDIPIPEPDLPLVPPKSPTETFSQYVQRVQPIVNERARLQHEAAVRSGALATQGIPPVNSNVARPSRSSSIYDMPNDFSFD